MTVLINARDEPRVLFDVGPLFDDPPALTGALTLTDPAPFTLSPPNTTVFFSEPARRDVCRPSRGTGVARDVSCESVLFYAFFRRVLCIFSSGGEISFGACDAFVGMSFQPRRVSSSDEVRSGDSSSCSSSRSTSFPSSSPSRRSHHTSPNKGDAPFIPPS
jgi:hypothetical protein